MDAIRFSLALAAAFVFSHFDVARAAEPVALDDVAQVGVGVDHSCALSRAGLVSCWGENGFGQLGVGDASGLTVRPTPVPVVGLGDGIRAIAVGGYHACAITAARGVRCWGFNAFGQLGDDSNDQRTTPVDVVGLAEPVLALSSGDAHTCALLEGGAVQCWGRNEEGQLGDGSPSDQPRPVTVSTLGGNARLIEAGSAHTCAALVDGRVRCWGANGEGQLGGNTTGDEPRPIDVQGLPGAVRSLAAGASSTCAVVESNGALYCWGSEYPLGAFVGGSRSARVYPGFESGNVAAASGTFHVCALRADNAIKCLGDNSNGQFGTGPIDGSLGVETAVGLAAGIVEVAAGGDHTCARSGVGRLQCWGRNTRGQLGIDAISKRLVPVAVAGLSGVVVDKVAAGGFHGCALSNGGGVKCWGANNQDQVGDGTRALRLAAVDVTGLTSGVRALAVGTDSSCAITAARRVKCWGANFDGRLGNGGNINSGVPVDVVGLGDVDVQAIAVGNSHGCALLAGGAVRCWGSNEHGQVGDGSTSQRNTAVAVSGLDAGVTAIAAGYYHSCAITAAGALKCWGINNSGQLGDGSRETRTRPVDVVGATSGVIAAGAGEQHTCAVRTGGAVQCWGFHFFGSVLGDGSTVDRSVPGDVPALRTGVTAITLGGYTTCVLQSGAAQCWGATIGDNTELTRPLPTPVAGLAAGVTSIDFGFGGQGCAVVGGVAKCWGENTFGQVGDGTTHGVPTPQTVLSGEVERRVQGVRGDANDGSTASASDGSGRYVVFQSRASNLVPGDSNGTFDIFRVDREDGTTLRVSVDAAGAQLAGASTEPAISSDGVLVVFVAPDAAVGKLTGESSTDARARRKTTLSAVYMHNMITGATQRIGTALVGGSGTRPQISASGNAVVFASTTAGGANSNVYVVPLTRDGNTTAVGSARCLSCKAVAANGSDTVTDSNGDARNPVLSGDGHYVAWETTAKNGIVATPSPCPGGGAEIHLRDVITGVMQRMSPPPTLAPANCGSTGSTQPTIDNGGTLLAFQTDQPLANADANRSNDVYVQLVAQPTAMARVSDAPDGADANGESTSPRLSGDGTSLAFVSSARNLDLGFADNNDHSDVHVADVATLEVARLSRTPNGAEIDAASERPALSYDGARLAFDSSSAALAGTTATATRVYQRSNPLARQNRSATWWKSSESGWGLTVFDQGNVLAPTWFTYDVDGEPTWFIVGGAFLQNDGSYQGELLRFTGTPYDQINGAAARSATPVGEVVLRYNGERALAFQYTVQGTTQTKTLESFPFGARSFSCATSDDGNRARATNYTDLWTGADVADAGWGLTLFHVDDGLFAIWYTYDADGEATFFVIAADRRPDGTFAGTVFRQRNGTPFQQIDGAPPSPDADAIGSAVFRFDDGDSARFEYTIGAVNQSKAITRLVVGSQPSVCQSVDAAPTR